MTLRIVDRDFDFNCKLGTCVKIKSKFGKNYNQLIGDIEKLDVNDKIGWSVKSGGQTISVSDSGTVSNENGKVVVHKKNAVKYGEAASQIIKVETDNVWGKNNGKYTATLTAYIRIGG